MAIPETSLAAADAMALRRAGPPFQQNIKAPLTTKATLAAPFVRYSVNT